MVAPDVVILALVEERDCETVSVEGKCVSKLHTPQL
jgi:hypothetical protein